VSLSRASSAPWTGAAQRTASFGRTYVRSDHEAPSDGPGMLQRPGQDARRAGRDDGGPPCTCRRSRIELPSRSVHVITRVRGIHLGLPPGSLEKTRSVAPAASNTPWGGGRGGAYGAVCSTEHAF